MAEEVTERTDQEGLSSFLSYFFLRTHEISTALAERVAQGYYRSGFPDLVCAYGVQHFRRHD